MTTQKKFLGFTLPANWKNLVIVLLLLAFLVSGGYITSASFFGVTLTKPKGSTNGHAVSYSPETRQVRREVHQLREDVEKMQAKQETMHDEQIKQGVLLEENIKQTDKMDGKIDRILSKVDG